MSSKGTTIITLQDVGLRYKVNNHFLSKKFSPIQALRDVSMEIARGDKIGIIGSNGAGKSTLMKLLAGIISPDTGKLWRTKGINAQLLSLGVGLEGSLSGRENAILNGMLLGKSRKTMLNCLDGIKDFSELGDFFEYPVNTYSSGMVARLGFSVALEINPDVLLIDELLGVGDAHFYEKSHHALKNKFNSEATLVLISHNAATIATLCEKAIWIDQGKMMGAGDTAEICDQYEKAMTG